MDIGTKGLEDFHLINRYPQGATLIWTNDSQKGGIDIFACFYDEVEKVWSKPKQLTNQSIKQ